MQPFVPCLFCTHLSKSEQKCKAFPDGIPDEIWKGENNHTKPVIGDNGIRFELKEREPLE